MIGTVIGNYRIERELGEGGMSHVWVGRTITQTHVLPQGYLVVLKIMADELAGEATAKKRFVKEGQILSQLRHRYITRFFEFIARDSGAVLVMEFVDGIPIDRLIHERGALDVAHAVSITQCLLEALVYAHGKGIVHRDIKPANLIQQKSGGNGVKVTDFGIAKIKEGGTSQAGQTVLTKSGFLLGTPHYMSPEQIREPMNAGAVCDVYSAGVVLYEMLTGTLPFNQRSLPKLIDAVYRGEKTRPRDLRLEVDEELDAIVLKAIHQDAAQRFDSARAFYEALEEYSEKVAVSPPPSLPAQPAQVGDNTMVRTGEVEIKWQLISARENGKEAHDIKADTVLVGRDRSCAIVLSHPAVSRRHARLTLAEGAFTLEDLKSANGTFVNNARVDRVSIKPGDVVRFGADPACSYVLRSR